MTYTEEEYKDLLARGTVREVGKRLAPPATAQELERGFMARIIRLAKECCYECYHTHNSRKSAPGFPDLILAKPGHPLLCIELKTNTGKPTMEQLQWLSLLQHTEKPQAALWRPRDWETIVAILHGKPQEPTP